MHLQVVVVVVFCSCLSQALAACKTVIDMLSWMHLYIVPVPAAISILSAEAIASPFAAFHLVRVCIFEVAECVFCAVSACVGAQLKREGFIIVSMRPGWVDTDMCAPFLARLKAMNPNTLGVASLGREV